MSDGNLRTIFRTRMPDVHWQGIETWSTGQGIPDMNGCVGGKEFWIENKQTSGWTITFEPGQVAWHERRIRAGGATFVAVRRQSPAGPRKGAAVDTLWLFKGSNIRRLAEEGLKENTFASLISSGGPARWDWDGVRRILTSH